MAKRKRQNLLSNHPNFSPLISVLRTELGPDWGIYNEFLEEVYGAIIAGENLSPWINQIQPLIQNQASRFAHQGVLFLLKEMQWRRSAKDKTGAASKLPSLDADGSSPSNLGNATEAAVPSSTAQLREQSVSKSTEMLTSNSESSALPAPALVPAAPASTADIVSQEQSHANTIRL